MAWIQPKTDWVARDYFNATDYNRINGNVAHLKAYLGTLFKEMEISLSEEEKTNLSLIYAREMNAIENGLSALNDGTYGLDIGESKTYKPNGKVPNFEDYNRLESATLALYEMAQVHKANLPRLALTLGQKGLRV